VALIEVLATSRNEKEFFLKIHFTSRQKLHELQSANVDDDMIQLFSLVCQEQKTTLSADPKKANWR
jgi:hypothetical protein